MSYRSFAESLPTVGLLAVLLVQSACNSAQNSSVKAEAVQVEKSTTIRSLIPADRLAKIKSALPKVHFQELSDIFSSAETLWYDHEVMSPSYQDSVGVNTNKDWPRLVAKTADTNPAIQGLHDAQQKRWQFPFSVTAGTDRSTNIKVVNFLHLPHVNGKPLSIPIWTVRKNANRPSWMWVYPIGTMFGEILFIDNNGEYLATEVRIRKRYKDSWATNVFRPFPTAASLASAIKAKRSGWKSEANLSKMIEHLEDTSTLKSESLSAKAALSKTFSDTAGADQIPNFSDPALVRELLTTTPFVSTYGLAWKENGNLKSFAPTTTERLSIVPTNYQAHVFAVQEDSCMRCHKEAGRRVSEFYDGLFLYGEVWGKDGIFSFHPFDEKEFSKLRTSGSGTDGYYDNRKINPALQQMGVFENYNASKHDSARYPARGN